MIYYYNETISDRAESFGVLLYFYVETEVDIKWERS